MTAIAIAIAIAIAGDMSAAPFPDEYHIRAAQNTIWGT